MGKVLHYQPTMFQNHNETLLQPTYNIVMLITRTHPENVGWKSFLFPVGFRLQLVSGRVCRQKNAFENVGQRYLFFAKQRQKGWHIRKRQAMESNGRCEVGQRRERTN